jgi:demethylmenaquinone methyltransferase / 2-methoxy-6-polyprenyl-1,4-benzoquinol methylase
MIMVESKSNLTDPAVTPYRESGLTKKEQVALMFNNISRRYDLLNTLLSFGIDRSWRKKAIALLKEDHPEYILDVATGTGEFAFAALELHPKKITGIDIAEGMLEKGRQKLASKDPKNCIELLQGDSENIPFKDNTFNAATVAFGVRNFENLEKGLLEIHRVLKPGGRLIVLEFSKPHRFPVKQLYWFYFTVILPVMGKIISKDRSAYNYLPDSVKAFPDGKLFLERLQSAGYTSTFQKELTFGIASIYSARKPDTKQTGG